MTTFRKITKRDKPQVLAATAARNGELLRKALLLAQRKAVKKRKIIREILATGKVEGVAERLNSKASVVWFRVPKYQRTWHTLIPWENLVETTPEEEAESILHTVVTNLDLTERNAWPKPPKEFQKKKSKSRPTRRSTGRAQRRRALVS
jgi:hypothetical protein